MPYVKNNGVNIHYEIEGEGSPLVLQHGLTGSLDAWKQLGYTDALRDRYRLILVDARGHGASDKPHEPEAYSSDLTVGDVVSVLDEIEVEKAHYWGYSMGGRVGYNLARHAPARLNSLILGGSSALPSRAGGEYAEKLLQTLLQGMEAVVEAWENETGQPFTTEARERILANDGEALVAALMGMILNPVPQDLLPSIAVPCLIYAGDGDPFYEGARDSAGRIPGCSFVSLPGMNHSQGMRMRESALPFVTKFLEDASH